MIRIDNVSKKFKLYDRPLDRMVEVLGLATRHRAFWALRDISLDIPRGRSLGIVGQNGAGKSTLLKLITGTLLPTTGSITVDGRVAALLELGTGFHPEFSGRQNIRVNGQLLGMKVEELDALESEIISFSELGPFIDQPLRTYSSGMVMRLGFSIAAALRPEVLIVDEALSVGDARFSQKCTRRIREFRENGATILFVSHDPTAVSALCDEAILLNQGRIHSHGTPKEVLEDYNGLLAAQGEGNRAMTVSWVGNRENGPAGKRRSGTFQALVTELDVLDSSGARREVFQTGDTLRLRVQVLFLTPVTNPTVGIALRDRLGLDLYGTNTALLGQEMGVFQGGESATVEVEIPLRLGYGDYSITVAIHENETHLESCFDWTDNAAVFRIREVERKNWSGLVEHQARLLPIQHSSGRDIAASALEPLFGGLPATLSLEDGQSPTPFLKGVRGLGEDSVRGRHRWLEREAWLVCRASAPEIGLRVGLDCRSPSEIAETRLRISLVGTGEILEFLPQSPHATLVFPVPRDFHGATVALRIETTPPVSQEAALQFLGMEEPAGVALFEVSSPPNHDAGWPVVHPMSSANP